MNTKLTKILKKDARALAIVGLCVEYDRENDPEERQNILRTLEEIVRNEPIELPARSELHYILGYTDAEYDYGHALDTLVK